MKDCVRYSEAFKLQVVRELEVGRHGSCNAAAEAYGIRGHKTVRGWVERYGRSHLLGKVMRVETPAERSELRKAKDRIRELEQALCDAHLDLRLSDAYLTLACDLGWKGSVEELKKKGGGMPSTERCRTAKERRR